MKSIALMRHGQAVVADFQTPDDARWLTARGREDAQRSGEALAMFGFRPDLVVSSPLVRAVQTAEIVASVLEMDAPIRALPALRSEGDPDRAAEVLEGLANDCGASAQVLAVCHEPIVRLISARLQGSTARSFQTAEVRIFRGGDCAWSHP